jgi:hypothetical protein
MFETLGKNKHRNETLAFAGKPRTAGTARTAGTTGTGGIG